MFDKKEIIVKAGKGGDGAVSFRREKFVPFGGPDGGDGGDGGNVILRADNGVTDFRNLTYKGIYKAGDGKPGSGKKKHGSRGSDRIIIVPTGTVVFKKDSSGEQLVIADLREDGSEVIVARGGKGGLGNYHFATPMRQTPRIAQRGEPGEELTLVLDLRLIADAGIIGYPNAGKSSLLAVASAAKPKIASYAFTTLEPILGVVTVDNDSFVLAEIPGLIEGAHLGKGLGHEFLQHALRTRVFIHLIDGSSKSPLEDMITVNNELSLYDPVLGKKSQVVAINKMDLPEVRERLDQIRKVFSEAGIDILFISAKTGEGVHRLMSRIRDVLKSTRELTGLEEESGVKVFYPEAKDGALRVFRREDGVIVVEERSLGRMSSSTGDVTPELREYVREKLLDMGLERYLKKLGVKAGDRIKCGDVEWEWI